MQDKVIVTHREALAKKYQTGGFAKIQAALSALIAADKQRGLKTAVVHLDNAAAMKKHGAKVVANPLDRRANKAAIDKVFASLKPDYLMILGAVDVVPHQDLANPAFSTEPDGDDDRWAYGDLPYACDRPYSRDPARFVGPTRVVARLPDLVGATEPSYLLALLKTAAKWKSRPPSAYDDYFGLSADVWKGSTGLSLEAIFGNRNRLLLAPPKGPQYSKRQLGARTHFINCHGAPAAPEFYGQKGKKYPVSLNSAVASRGIVSGTIASVECCYGAELYDSVALGIDKPICQSYLGRGAYAYLGSTTVAYGPADENGAADLICQYFLSRVLEGASIGAAALMARQEFVAAASQMDPIDLKTLAQFCLYGDPSVHPVQHEKVKDVKGQVVAESERFRRKERRKNLRDTGESLQEKKPTASKRASGRTSGAAKTALMNIARRGGLPGTQVFSAFKVKGAKVAKGSTKGVVAAPSRYFVAVGQPKPQTHESVGRRVAIVAKEARGRIMDYRIYRER